MKNLFSALVFVIIAMTVSFPAFALGGLEFLSKSPIAYFTPEDSALFKGTLQDLLNNQPDGKVVKWSNQKSTHSGKMKSTRTYLLDGSRCRTIKFFNNAGGRTGKGKFDFCKQDDGSWKIVPKQKDSPD